MMRAWIGLMLMVPGCPWVTDADIEDLEDWDDDGFADVLYDGDDCDDTDPEIHPGAPDEAGDGIDSDCGGTDGEDPSDTGSEA